MSLTLKSPSFDEGQPIPVDHTEDGADLSPALTWTAPTQEAASFALIVDDPDAPVEEPWVHWIIANIPASTLTLPAGFHEEKQPGGAPENTVQGLNTWGTVGYRGPAPPPGHGVHHYHFKLFALDAMLPISIGVSKHDLLEMMSGHVVARGELVGTYKRD